MSLLMNYSSEIHSPPKRKKYETKNNSPNKVEIVKASSGLTPNKARPVTAVASLTPHPPNDMGSCENKNIIKKI